MISNNFTPVADNLPPAVVCSAESAAGGSDLPVSVLTDSNREGLVQSALIETARESNAPTMMQLRGTLAAGNSFEASGKADGTPSQRPSSSASEYNKNGGTALASFPIPHICISCGQTLRAKHDASRVVVYCGYGPCKSKAANEGAFGRTVEEAVDELNARILEEPYAD